MKELKLCLCGAKVRAKGMCHLCYMKDRYLQKVGTLQRNKIEHFDIDRHLKNVIDLVQIGYTIIDSLNKLKIRSSKFYKHISIDQKRILDEQRALYLTANNTTLYYKKTLSNEIYQEDEDIFDFK